MSEGFELDTDSTQAEIDAIAQVANSEREALRRVATGLGGAAEAALLARGLQYPDLEQLFSGAQ